jgi:VanZ family protein
MSKLRSIFSISIRSIRYFFWAICVAVFVCALLPPNYLPTHELQFNWIDKIQHVVVFVGLCIIGLKGYPDQPYALIFGLLVMGGAIEVAQYATGWRHMEFYDFIADACGILIGRGACCLMCLRDRTSTNSA